MHAPRTLFAVLVAASACPAFGEEGDDSRTGSKLTLQTSGGRVIVEIPSIAKEAGERSILVPRKGSPFGLAVRIRDAKGASLPADVTLRDGRGLVRVPSGRPWSVELKNEAEYDVAAFAFVEGEASGLPTLVAGGGSASVMNLAGEKTVSRITIVLRVAVPPDAVVPAVEPAGPPERTELRPGNDPRAMENVVRQVGPTILAAGSFDVEPAAVEAGRGEVPSRDRWNRVRRWR